MAELGALARLLEERNCLERERDEARRWLCFVFRKMEMMEQLYGCGPEVVRRNPWMLEPGPWQEPVEEEGDGG